MMRLGMIMLGTGAYAAANVGALRALRLRGIEPYAVCGMHFGAFIAALHLCGSDEREMEDMLKRAARDGKRLLCAQRSVRGLMRGKEKALCDGGAINRLLISHTGERLLGLCERRGFFPCRSSSSGRRVIFSTKPYAQGADAALTMQASVAFACRAAMAQPPFLTPMPWLGAPLLPEGDPAFAAEQMIKMGADRVLIVEPRACMSHEPDALELCAAPVRWSLEERLPEGTGVLRVMMPCDVSAMRFEDMPRIAQAGFSAAQAQLDGVLRGMGMAMCRILPFRPRAAQVSPR